VALKKSLIRARPLANCGGCELTPALRHAGTKVTQDSGGNTVGAEHISSSLIVAAAARAEGVELAVAACKKVRFGKFLLDGPIDAEPGRFAYLGAALTSIPSTLSVDVLAALIFVDTVGYSQRRG